MAIEVKGEIGHELGDYNTAVDVMTRLNREYPGWEWVVGINDEKTGGVMVILSKIFEAYSPLHHMWGLRVPITSVYADPDRRRILRHAGLMLEFCGLPRTYTGGDLDLTQFARNYETYTKDMNYGFGPKD